MPQKFASLFLSILLFFSGASILHAQEQAALAPMGALGNFSEVEKQILFNALQENLSIHYSLVSQQRFETAQEQAFDELEAEECTEDQCFAKIQELLQVENLFIFSIAKDNTYTQLSLTRVDIDGQRTVRTALCKQCNLEELNAKTADLVQSISGKPAASATATVTRGKGSVFVSSEPKDAEIVLDGKILEEQGDLLLKDLIAGKHRILLRKGDLEVQKDFEIKANEMINLNLRLKLKQVPLLISSEPFQATVLLDGTNIGQTPLQTQSTVGRHQLTVQLKGYVPHTQTITLNSKENTEVDVLLKALGTLELTRLHPNAQISLDGKTIVNQGLKTQTLLLAPGKHKLTLQRSGFPVRKQSVTIQSKQTSSVDAHIPSGHLVLKNLEPGDAIKVENRPSFTSTAPEHTLELPPGTHEVTIQRYGFKLQKQMLRLEDGASEMFEAQWTHTQRYLEYQSWSNKRWMVTGSAALAFLYMTTESAKVKTANDEKKALEEKIIASSTDEEAASYNSQAQAKVDEAKSSQQSAQTALVLTLGLAGWATWVWMEEPPQPQSVGWNWNITPQQQMSVSYLKRW